MGRLERNLALLSEMNPAAAAAVAQASAPQDLSVSEGPCGPVVAVGGHRLASAYDPRAEAHALLDAAEIPGAATVVFFGLGLGHHVEELLKSRPAAAVLVVEPSLELARVAFETRDLSAILCPRVVFAFTDDPVAIRDAVGRMAAYFTSRPVKLIGHPPSAALCDYSRARAAVRDSVQWLEMNCRTCFAKGLQCTANALCNIPHMAESAGLGALAGRFKGVPAFCVAAGPSLDKNAAALSAVAGRGLIIAVNTAWRPLRSLGIEPDVVCAIDFSEAVMRHFDGLTSAPTQTTLFFDPEVYPGVPASFPGPRLTAHVAKPVGAWLSRRLPRGMVRKGLTVAHAAFHLAEALGCDPIVLVGQDLSYPDMRSHAADAAMASDMKVVKRGGVEYLLRTLPDGTSCLNELLWVEGRDGRQLPTTQDMYSYKTHFEALVSETAATVVNATEGGARIRGTVEMPLACAVERYCCRPVDFAGAFREAASATGRPDPAELALALTADAEELTALAEEASHGRKLVGKLRHLGAAGALMIGRKPKPAACRLIEDIEGCARGLMSSRVVYKMVKDAAAADMYAIRRMADEAGRRFGKAEILARVDRQEAYFEAMACAAATLADILTSVGRFVDKKRAEGVESAEGVVCRR